MLSWSFGVSKGLLKLGFYFLHHWELYSSSLFTCRDPHNCRDHGCHGLNGLRPLLWPPLIFGTYTAWFPQVAWPQTADPRLTLFPRASLGCRWSWFSQSSLWPRQLLLPPPYFRSIHMSLPRPSCGRNNQGSREMFWGRKNYVPATLFEAITCAVPSILFEVLKSFTPTTIFEAKTCVLSAINLKVPPTFNPAINFVPAITLAVFLGSTTFLAFLLT